MPTHPLNHYCYDSNLTRATSRGRAWSTNPRWRGYPLESVVAKRCVVVKTLAGSAWILTTIECTQAIFELIVTEAAYIRDLQLIVEVWRFCSSV